ncbi:hypothetical protein HPB47_004799 [Ixodes persulcatus]|uniref:Uncharacterized protein n=1 Tax=Ixodes persulcatus TaxID=34615 RepID=A0AC60PFH8_IXOPE|nr:hypothetical protein HPB47_004799 [Ixodes persulcatus]
MATGNSALTDLVLLADVATATGLAERNATAVTAAPSPDTPTVSPVVSMPQNTEMSRRRVQFLVKLDFQPSIAPGGLSQLGHNHSPSTAHHSMAGQSQGGQAHCSRTPLPRRPPPSRSRHSLL